MKFCNIGMIRRPRNLNLDFLKISEKDLLITLFYALGKTLKISSSTCLMKLSNILV